jgi:muramoyltetrapeptide carboxypeptidase
VIGKNIMPKNTPQWCPLAPGDLIDVIAPSSGIEAHQINRAAAFVKSFGFTPRIHKEICGSTPYYSHQDEYRLEQLVNALHAEDSKAIWCLRGGYGSTRLLPKLLHYPAPKQCKLVIGFSDITALHILLNQHWNWPTLHAPVLFQAFENLVDEVSLETLKKLMLGTLQELQYPQLIPLNDAAKQSGHVKGSILGGNLSLLQSSLGTPWQINPKGKILFIEEVSERGYRVDRMLTHLSQASALESIQAILFGDLIGGDEKNGGNFINYALSSFVSQVSVPVVQCKSLGHGKRNLPLPLNTPISLTLGTTPSLTCTTGAHYV